MDLTPPRPYASNTTPGRPDGGYRPPSANRSDPWKRNLKAGADETKTVHETAVLLTATPIHQFPTLLSSLAGLLMLDSDECTGNLQFLWVDSAATIPPTGLDQPSSLRGFPKSSEALGCRGLLLPRQQATGNKREPTQRRRAEHRTAVRSSKKRRIRNRESGIIRPQKEVSTVRARLPQSVLKQIWSFDTGRHNASSGRVYKTI